MLVRLFTFFFFIFGMSVAEAAPRAYCDSLLSLPMTMSVAAKSYVGLIQHYTKQSSDQQSDLVLDKISDAKELYNPFAGKIDSFSVQMSAGIEKLRAHISSDDVELIRNALTEHLQGVKVEREERASQEDETALMFDPAIISEVKLGNHYNPEISWLHAGGRALLAVVYRDGSGKHKLYVYEIVEGQLALLSQLNLNGDIDKPVLAWQVVGKEVFLSYTTYEGELLLFKMGKKRITEKSRIAIRQGASMPAWHVINGKVFVAVASGGDTNIHLFELKDSRLNPIWSQQRKVSKGTFKNLFGLMSEEDLENWPAEQKGARPAWITVQGRTFVTIGSTDQNFYLFEFVNGGLEFRERHKADAAFNNEPVWQIVGDRVFVAIASHYKVLHLYELVNGSLEDRGHKYFSDAHITTASWKIIHGRVLLAVGTSEGLHIFELVNGRLEDRKHIGVPDKGLPFSVPVWQELNGDILVTLGDKEHIYLYIFDENFELTQEADLAGYHWLPKFSTPASIIINNQHYISYEVHTKLFLVEVYNKLEKQGGRK